MSWPNRNKYNAQRTTGFDRRSYPSKCEAAVADALFALEKAGEIDGYECQHQIVFPCSVKWKVDFLAYTKGGECLIEAKGFVTADYRVKLKSYRGCDFKGKLPLFVYGRNRSGLYLMDSIAADGMEPPI